MDKKIVCIFGLSLFMVILISNVLAITAKIGNGVMVLRAETGDKIEKYVLVINDNDVAVDIKLTTSGDLKDYITIKDTNFTLEPGEEKKAYFTIEVGKEGTTKSKINVQFTPVGEKNGVGLSSTITVIAEKGSGLLDFGDEDLGNEEENNNKSNDTNEEVSVVTGKAIEENGISSVAIILLVITGIIFLIFIVLLIIAYKKTNKKRKKENKTKLIKLKRSVKKRG